MSNSANTTRPNYRIYDRTGGGVTEDIYADSLEDAIEQGREWIEGGEWDGVADGTILDCSVGPIIYRPSAPAIPADVDSDLRSNPCWADGCWQVCVSAADEAAMIARLPGVWRRHEIDKDGDIWLAWAAPADAAVEIDDEATRLADTDECDGVVHHPEPGCSGEHDWRSPHDIVGGLRENPGVWGSQHGGVRITEVCAVCGQYRITDTGATDQGTGRRTESVTYRDADDDSLAWVESLRA